MVTLTDDTCSLADALKQHTSDAHRHAETRDLQKQMARGEVDLATLGTYLGQLAIVHRLLETAFDRLPEVASIVSFDDGMRHSHRLERDVRELGVTEPVAATDATARLLDELTRLIDETPEALIGAFYVLEGSMNGNRFIVRALRGRHAAAGASFAYFDPYGEEQPRRWADFRNRLGSHEPDAAARDAILQSAAVMFAGIAAISDDALAVDQPQN